MMLSNDPKLTLSFRYCDSPEDTGDSFLLRAGVSCRFRLLTASNKAVVTTISLVQSGVLTNLCLQWLKTL